jgi:iron-sulfur cluster insertion protein
MPASFHRQRRCQGGRSDCRGRQPDLKLRVFVQGGGCSGFQYGFTFDEITNEDDTTMTKNGVSLLIDAMSYQYLVGAEIDYKEDLQGAQFVIKNPNATTTCGCGSSFFA